MLSQALSPARSALIRADGRPVEWRVTPRRTDYAEAEAEMEARVADIRAGEATERVWLLEHPPLYTAGVSARPEDLIDARFPVHKTGRGGQFTYHGPGQRVAYVMLDLDQRGRDIRGFVRGLERWIIGALAEFGIEGEVKDGRVGVWVTRKGPGWSREDKIAAIGVKVRKWVSFHGISLNVEPDLDHFGGIVPCGIREHGVTSLHDLGVLASMDEVDAALKSSFEREFGSTVAG
ncbi:lipoyl(octanoyl) transferase LipB [Brevundimonas poindexterae]|uniref:lipoyl(octanoyl) transferase LipB n=1 Tax=Brevundimonas poindexterae TaxID=74325 RepID=UPI001CFEC21D|nr:lipoyl(octanoyl) transferase LipB [Brevundimonas poindexterae]